MSASRTSDSLRQVDRELARATANSPTEDLRSTPDGRPRIFLGFQAFTQLREVLAHELIHSGGPRAHRSMSNDLEYLGVGYDNIIDACAD